MIIKSGNCTIERNIVSHTKFSAIQVFTCSMCCCCCCVQAELMSCVD